MIITDVYARSAALLASQFQETLPNGDMTNFQKLIYAFCTEGQNIQDVLQELLTQRWLSTAVGQQLDNLGQIIGLARKSGQPDDTQTIDNVLVIGYRQDLQFQIFYNNSNATPEEIIYITKYITQADFVIYNEYYPAAYQVIIDTPLIKQNGIGGFWNVYEAITVPILLKNAGPAGVAYPPITTTMAVEKPFSFSSDVIFEPMYASKDDFLPAYLVPFYVDEGAGATQLYVQRGETINPKTGGGFAEYYDADTKTCRLPTMGNR